jgi:hypothetical protein
MRIISIVDKQVRNGTRLQALQDGNLPHLKFQNTAGSLGTSGPVHERLPKIEAWHDYVEHATYNDTLS